MGVNYGLDKVRFMNATVVGSLVRARVSLLTAEDVPGGLRYKMKLVFELKGQEKPACVAEFIAQAYTDSSKKKNETASTGSTQNLNDLKTDCVLYKKEGTLRTSQAGTPTNAVQHICVACTDT